MNFRTISDMDKLINQSLHIIPKVDLIVGIPRSGMLPATIISLYFNRPLTDIDSFVRGQLFSTGITKKGEKWIDNIEDVKTVLVVEDSSDSGNSINKAKKKLENLTARFNIKYLVIYGTENSQRNVDFCLEICNPPRMFEWNYMHSMGMNEACVDIDGVLCPDPTVEENDDGANYIKFLRSTPVRLIPTRTINTLVSCRLEKYREETEKWLKKNGIKYDNLILMDIDTKEERLKLGNHGKYKGQIYKSSRCTHIFIESDDNQAKEIAEISGKACYCTSSGNFYREGIITSLIRNTDQGIRRVLKKILPDFIVRKLSKG